MQQLMVCCMIVGCLWVLQVLDSFCEHLVKPLWGSWLLLNSSVFCFTDIDSHWRNLYLVALLPSSFSMALPKHIF